MNKCVPTMQYNAKFAARGVRVVYPFALMDIYLVCKFPMQGLIVIQFDSIVLSIHKINNICDVYAITKLNCIPIHLGK